MTKTFKIFIAADHAGFALKEKVIIFLKENNYNFEDCGSMNAENCDYPIIAQEVSRKILTEKNSKGILICGTGIGMSIAANRFKWIRAALCTHEFHAKTAREHNDANILCLGERITAPALACKLTEYFLTSSFAGARHERRVKLIDENII